MTRSRTEIARQSIDGSGVELDQPLFSPLSFEGDVPVSLQGFADRESALATAGEEVRG
jgi:hypothetical protein